MGRPIETETMTQLGRNIVKLAELKGWTMTQVAASLGWSPGRLSRLCRTEAVYLMDVYDLARLFSVDPHRLASDERWES